jgi:hypothetical protein
VRVLVVPEAATLYHKYGARLPFASGPSSCGTWSADERNLLWECLLNELKRSLETKCVNEVRARARTNSDRYAWPSCAAPTLRRLLARPFWHALWHQEPLLAVTAERVPQVPSVLLPLLQALAARMPSIILCDRGIFDSRAYLPSEESFATMLEMATWTEEEIATRRSRTAPQQNVSCAAAWARPLAC